MTTTIENLAAEYRKCGEAFGAAIMLGDPHAIQKCHNKRARILKKLRACGESGKTALRQLMEDHSDAVALWAATDCILFAEADALKVLDAIGKKNGLIPFTARMTAHQWRAGELNIRQQNESCLLANAVNEQDRW